MLLYKLLNLELEHKCSLGKMSESSSDIPLTAKCFKILYKAYMLHFQALNQCQMTDLECITLPVKMFLQVQSGHFIILLHFIPFSSAVTFSGNDYILG